MTSHQKCLSDARAEPWTLTLSLDALRLTSGSSVMTSHPRGGPLNSSSPEHPGGTWERLQGEPLDAALCACVLIHPHPMGCQPHASRHMSDLRKLVLSAYNPGHAQHMVVGDCLVSALTLLDAFRGFREHAECSRKILGGRACTQAAQLSSWSVKHVFLLGGAPVSAAGNS